VLYIHFIQNNHLLEKFMNRKISALFLAMIVMMLTMAGRAAAQFNYDVTNDSPVSIDVIMSGTCPGPPTSAWIATKTILPGQTYTFIIPLPPCTWSIEVNGVTYPLGYNGSVAPPNPPSWITVNATNTVVK
jgi:hypothetical protein